MNDWQDAFKEKNIFFITPDVKRGIGVEDLLPSYHIICSYLDPLVAVLRGQGARIFCLEEEIGDKAQEVNNSSLLFEQPSVLDYLKKNAGKENYISYFKPSLKLDMLIGKSGFKPAGISALLNEELENKIKFAELLRNTAESYVIPYEIAQLAGMKYGDLTGKFGLPFVIQLSHSWAGKNTFFISDENQYIQVKNKYSHVLTKISKYIAGITVINNCCLYRGKTFASPPALQLSGISLLHPKPAVTCGRQWSNSLFTCKQEQEIQKVTEKIGQVIGQKNFQGFFGIDFLIEDKTGKIYISEVNPRLTASASFYTKLERKAGDTPLFILHLAAFCDIVLDGASQNKDITGSQIILRLPKFSALNDKLAGFGVYQTSGTQYKLIKREYYPEKLEPNQFLYLPRQHSEKINHDNEIARIETRDQGVTKNKQPAEWLAALLS